MSRTDDQKKLLPSSENTPLEERVKILYKMVGSFETNRSFVGIIDSSFPCNQQFSDHFTASNSCYPLCRGD